MSPRVKDPLIPANEITPYRLLTPKSAAPVPITTIPVLPGHGHRSPEPTVGPRTAGDIPAQGGRDFDPGLPSGVTPAAPSPLLSLSPPTAAAREFGKVGDGAPRAHPRVKGLGRCSGSYLELGEGRGTSSPRAPAAHPPAAPAAGGSSQRDRGLQPSWSAPVPPQPGHPQRGAHPRLRLRSHKRKKAAMRQR